MEKGNYFLKMEILNMKVIGLMIIMKELEKVFGKMGNIIMENGKMV